MLPANLQEQFEAEADIFAAEAFFFADKFVQQVAKRDWGLAAAAELADDVYGTSFHATFRHYVESSDKACCLLVWRPSTKATELWTPSSMSLHYYIPSPSFNGHIDPGQVADPDDVVSKLYSEPSGDRVVKHEMRFEAEGGTAMVAPAQSFSNSYVVFTLVSQPQPLKLVVSV